ncbi:bifunctional riboflavin kinase/FAD synthetase [Coleofasciculus sp. FACHB-501]|uniref:bifunctional riboflavin kinase/FAD synthetase n=1 Tax=Cyanophyceae TaxID=3028117 RepID=UPI001684AB31|nr:bifunctional riboflavin kinase/FAD synthetase [Coleofasciculus sp. FACHB-501]
MWVTSSPDTALKPTAVALGNFDGVHRGHQQVVKPILKASDVPGVPTLPPSSLHRRLEYHWQSQSEDTGRSPETKILSSNEYPIATVVTFNPHPREFFTGQRRGLLTPRPEKVRQLEALGVEQLVLLPFDRELAALSPQQFVEKILVRQLRAQSVSVGEDFRFGCQRAGTGADLKAIAHSYGINVTLVPLQTCEGERISSSVIRQALQEGDLEQANRLLGRPYTLTGLVVKGQQLGRTIGFPTANLQLPSEKFLPRQGVYCVRVYSETEDGSEATGQTETGNGEAKVAADGCSLPIEGIGVMNIGNRPTVDGTTSTLEVHLLDWVGDLYGKTLTVSLEQFLRPEQKFASLDALKTQIQVDCEAARALFRTED